MSKQLQLFDDVGDGDGLSPTDVVGDRKIQAIQRYLDRAPTEPTASVSTYKPSGRKTEYFRLVYRTGKKVKTIHIRGGNVRSKLAQYRADKLIQMINRGAELDEILAAVRTFNSD